MERMTNTIQAMRIFVRAVEVNSFVAAARSLLIDPAVVSRAIKALEADLGVLLFARSTRALRLTAEGERHYRDSLEVLRKLEEARQRFRTRSAAPTGQLKVGMALGLPRRMLLRTIPEFQKQYPQIELVLLCIDTVGEIREKGVDVFIRPRSLRQRGGQHPANQGLVMRKLVQSHFIVCAAPRYIELHGAPKTPADLIRHACAIHVTLERDVQNEWFFSKAGVRRKIKFVPSLLVQGVEALREAGIAGCGIIQSNAYNVDDELRSGKLVQVLPGWESLGAPPVVAIYRKTNPVLTHVSVFVRYLMEAFRRYNVQPGVRDTHWAVLQ
jgi:DNA-binding transcriptional LysR family regulator